MNNSPRSMRPFLTIWFGQLVSSLGSAMTSFGVGLWIYTEGGSVTAFALNNVALLVPWALLSPIAGAYVDRYNRKMIMLVADTVQAIATLFIALFIFSDALQIWQVYVAVAISSAASAFQGPAWTSSVSLLVPKQQLGRAAGLGRLNEAVSRLLAPIVAGALLLTIGLGWILVIDLVTFLVALLTLWMVVIPQPPKKDIEPAPAKGRTWQEIKSGVRYLWQRPGLLALVMIGSLRNLIQNFATVLLLPLALMFTDVAGVGRLQTLMMTGMLVGTVIMSAWGGPKQWRIRWSMSVMIVHGLAIAFAGLYADISLILGGMWVMMFTFAMLATLNGPVYQTKVAPDVQGRVFSTITFLVVVLEPIGMLFVGPITDNFLEPGMLAGGNLAPLFGALVGVGPGRGMGLVFLIAGLLIAGLGVYGWLNPRVRNLDVELPDQLPDEPAAATPPEQKAIQPAEAGA